MEPLFFKAENESARSHPVFQSQGFNGAAFFQSGKLAEMVDFIIWTSSLQWSRFFSKRKIWRQVVYRVNNRVLQWSRFFSKRKMCNEVRTIVREELASMEPLFFKAENQVDS